VQNRIYFHSQFLVSPHASFWPGQKKTTALLAAR
jgi:hypothetical protein